MKQQLSTILAQLLLIAIVIMITSMDFVTTKTFIVGSIYGMISAALTETIRTTMKRKNNG